MKIIDPIHVHLSKPEDEYVDVYGHMEFAKSLILDPQGRLRNMRNNFLLMGPPGVGKSLMVQNLFYSIQETLGTKIPYFTLEASEDTREHHLKGCHVLLNDTTPFVLGKIAAAVYTANTTGVVFLNVEEITAMCNGTQKILNSLLDIRRCVDIPEANLHLKLDPDAHIIFASSMNPVLYGGVNALNRDLVSRLNVRLMFDYPESNAEVDLLQKLTGAKKKLIVSLVRVAQLSRIRTMEYEITTRDLRHAILTIQVTGNYEKALTSLIAPFSSSKDEYRKMLDRVNACFDVDIKEGQRSYEDKVQVYTTK